MNNSSSAGLTNEIYIPFVESLYANRSVVVFGLIAQAIFAIAIAESTGDNTFYVFAALFVASGIGRLVDSLLFDRAKNGQLTAAKSRYWETRYSIGVNVVGLQLGTLCYLSILSGDNFAEFASMTLVMATMVTIVGKNFASRRIVHLFSLFTLAPIFVALVQIGGWKYNVGALLLIPFFLIINSMARYVREFLKEAVLRRLEVKQIADRLDVALNNMPQGLIMFDDKRRSLVVNNRAAEMLRAPGVEALRGRSLQTILRFCRFKKVVPDGLLEDIEERLTSMFEENVSRKFLLKTHEGTSVEFTGRKAGNGGGVLIFEDVSERVEAEEKIHRMARFDALSGLPNRTHFKEMVRSIIQKSPLESYAAFFVIDIDDFKHVNDSFGHPVGDELLCRLADRINLISSPDACFSRFGGDEFVGMLAGFETAADAEAAARQILMSLAGIYEVASQSLAVTISSGIVINRSHAFDLQQMMIKSDLALYESKMRGKGISTLFAEAMDERYQKRQRLKADLKKAIRDRQLNVFYQPIIRAENMRIASCEALCRWDHPELGPISPGIFIPLAEETGSITELTRFMLEQACEDCKGWEGDVSVSVNLSAVDFRGSQIGEMVRNALSRSRLEASRLEVEVTESAILEDQHTASSMLLELKKAGIRIALDDFGTGYSSLSYLHNLPLDKVKIDQSFVRDIVSNDRSLKLVSGVTQLAHELGLVVTVEGIETLEQFERLKAHAHIDMAQGFLFGAALSSRGIATLISSVFSSGEATSAGRRVA
jgi:diguanylate cyclase (GGDEF)-like protein